MTNTTSKNVRLLRVPRDVAQEALVGMREICGEAGVSTQDFDTVWKYAQLVTSYLLAEYGELPRSTPQCHVKLSVQ